MIINDDDELQEARRLLDACSYAIALLKSFGVESVSFPEFSEGGDCVVELITLDELDNMIEEFGDKF